MPRTWGEGCKGKAPSTPSSSEQSVVSAESKNYTREIGLKRRRGKKKEIQTATHITATGKDPSCHVYAHIKLCMLWVHLMISVKIVQSLLVCV